MQAHLLETRNYWFQASWMRLFVFSLCLFLIFILIFLLFFCIFFSFIISFHPFFSVSSSTRYSLTWRIHFCCFTFIIANPSRSQFVGRQNSTSSSYAEGSSLRSRETASKNDYSEINNNDITARRRSIRVRGNGFHRLTWIFPVCDIWCSNRNLHDDK